jgi:hypothetical protein
MRKERGGKRLIYVSRSLIPKTNMEEHARSVTQILRSAREVNTRLGVTGMLLLHGPYFGQVLEGKVKALRKVMSRIKRDKRHSEIIVLCEEPMGSRVFGDWSMGLVLGGSDKTYRVKLRDDKDGTEAGTVSEQVQSDLIAQVRQMLVDAEKTAQDAPPPNGRPVVLPSGPRVRIIPTQSASSPTPSSSR